MLKSNVMWDTYTTLLGSENDWDPLERTKGCQFLETQ